MKKYFFILIYLTFNVMNYSSTFISADHPYIQYFEGGYVTNGHPTVETHQKIENQVISAIESFKIFTE